MKGVQSGVVERMHEREGVASVMKDERKGEVKQVMEALPV